LKITRSASGLITIGGTRGLLVPGLLTASGGIASTTGTFSDNLIFTHTSQTSLFRSNDSGNMIVGGGTDFTSPYIRMFGKTNGSAPSLGQFVGATLWRFYNNVQMDGSLLVSAALKIDSYDTGGFGIYSRIRHTSSSGLGLQQGPDGRILLFSDASQELVIGTGSTASITIETTADVTIEKDTIVRGTLNMESDSVAEAKLNVQGFLTTESSLIVDDEMVFSRTSHTSGSIDADNKSFITVTGDTTLTASSTIGQELTIAYAGTTENLNPIITIPVAPGVNHLVAVNRCYCLQLIGIGSYWRVQSRSGFQ
jgi:phage baseplate assembly protein gpV